MHNKTISDKIKELDFKPTILVDQVSEILADAILEGVLRGGDKLVETELVRQFGISRAPIREAFRELEKRGLVEIVPRKGTYVRVITERDIKENFPVRAALEGLAAGMAYGNLAVHELARMEKLLESMEGSAQKNDTKSFRAHHNESHEIFIHACGNDVLIKILRTLRLHSLWHRFCYQYYQEDFKKSLGYHKRINSLFKNKSADPREIESLVRDHIEVALERFINYLKG